MNVLIAGGSGFLGRALTRSLAGDGHRVWILSRRARAVQNAELVHWDATTDTGWGRLVNQMDAIVNLCGKSMAAWPWTGATKHAMRDSRLKPGLALSEAVRKADRPPGLFIQASGINHYGLAGDLADEFTPPGNDFLASLTVDWENSTKSVEERGVRRVITRSAVILDNKGGLLPVMALPVKLFLGGPLAGGKQAMPWIHLADQIGSIRFLMHHAQARGPFNLIAPTATSNEDFMRSLAIALHRPYWFPAPKFALKLLLGGLSDLIVGGRFSQPKRLVELGYRFQFERPAEALMALFR